MVFVSAALALSIAAATSTCRAGDPLLGWKGKPLAVAIADEDYLPFHSRIAGGKVTGFDADIADALCAAMQAKCSIRAVPWDRLLQDLRARQSDVVISAMDITDERLKLVDFTAPYLRPPAALLVRKGTLIELTAAGVKGHSISVSRACPKWRSVALAYLQKKLGTGADIRIYDMAPKCPKRGYFTLDEYRSRLPEQIADLKAGEVDAVFDEKLTLYNEAHGSGLGETVEFSGGDWFDYSAGAGIALRKKQPVLKAALNAGLELLHEDGTYKRLESKYFPFPVYGE